MVIRKLRADALPASRMASDLDREHIDPDDHFPDGMFRFEKVMNGISFDPIHSEKHDEETFMGIRMMEKLVEVIVYRKVFGVNTLIIRLGMGK